MIQGVLKRYELYSFEDLQLRLKKMKDQEVATRFMNFLAPNCDEEGIYENMDSFYTDLNIIINYLNGLEETSSEDSL